MATPASSGVLATTFSSMNIGDYIACTYVASSGAVGTFSNLGGTGTEIPVTSTATPNGIFYFVKVDKGLFISDRVVQISISWDTLNSGNFIQGKSVTLGGTAGTVRSLTGGVAYVDANGLFTLTQPNPSKGAFPTNNEWDKYVIGSNLTGKITAGDDNVWHYSSLESWTQGTPVNGTWTPKSGSAVTSANSKRVSRGIPSNASFPDVDIPASSSVISTLGFRPVFQF